MLQNNGRPRIYGVVTDCEKRCLAFFDLWACDTIKICGIFSIVPTEELLVVSSN
mgnify:CR=1 FL=1